MHHLARPRPPVSTSEPPPTPHARDLIVERVFPALEGAYAERRTAFSLVDLLCGEDDPAGLGSDRIRERLGHLEACSRWCRA